MTDRATVSSVLLLIVFPLSVCAGTLSLEAHEIGTKNVFHSNWETDWGSYDRDYARGKRILVTVHDMSRKVMTCDVVVYFVAQPIFGGKRFIYDCKKFTPQFRGRIEITGPVDSVDLMANVKNYAALGEEYGKGAKIDGWIVIGRANQSIFDIKASSQTLLEIAQESRRQPESLSKMIADYETATSRHK